MYGYVYKTTDLRNNKIYVGQHKSKVFDTNYYGSGIIIKEILNKYGNQVLNCELIEECDTADELNDREIYWINKLNCLDESVGYNLATGGAFGNSGYHKGMCGKSQSDKQKNAARDYQLNNPKTEQMKQKMSVKMKGNTNAKGGKGMKFIHIDYDTQKRVHPSELDYYLSNGWELGKCQRVIDNQKKAYLEKYKNGSYINKNGKIKFVDNKELDKFLSKGWIIGKKIS